MADDAAPPTPGRAEAPKKHPNYTAVFAAELIELARTDRRIVGITAGMPTGTGLSQFEAEFPDRFFDVGIAEQHAVTFATGLAMGGMRPVVALYSTFLQRAFDQTVHDVCQNDQPVLHRGRPRRARRRGRDEPPGDVHAAGPAPAAEPRHRLATRRAGAALAGPDRVQPGPPVRPPLPARRRVRPAAGRARRSCPVGRGEVLREGHDLLFVGFGPIVARALEAADALEAEGWSVGVINARFAKPLDGQLILDGARGKRLVVTFEESVVTGGFGSGVLELVEEARLTDPALRDVAVRIVGIPGDRFVDHGSVQDLRRVLRLDAPGLADAGPRDPRRRCRPCRARPRPCPAVRSGAGRVRSVRRGNEDRPARRCMPRGRAVGCHR